MKKKSLQKKIVMENMCIKNGDKNCAKKFVTTNTDYCDRKFASTATRGKGGWIDKGSARPALACLVNTIYYGWF